MRDLRDDINSLSNGKATKRKIGSRAVGHHLRPQEKPKLQKAIERGYLELDGAERENIKNIFQSYCENAGFPALIIQPSQDFPQDLQRIQERIKNISPNEYSNTRNYLDGAVTKLSPYLTHGIISLKQVYEEIKETNPNLPFDHQLYKELAWKEYFHRIWESIGDKIFSDIRDSQKDTESDELPEELLNAETGIKVVDSEVLKLYKTGYIHNHSRMWVASLFSNIYKTQWKVGADWMYYHLLDGDLASNYLSWQWVAGTFSSKKYYANQWNINKFSKTCQKNTFLDVSYREISKLKKDIKPKYRVVIEYQTDWSFIKSDDYKNTQTLLYHPWCLELYAK